MTPVKIMMIALSLYGYASPTTSFSCNYWEDKHFNLHADCSSRKLKLVPVVLSNVSFLDLSSNSITVLENKTFEYLSILQELNLGSNMLKWLEQEAFIGLQDLKRLMLVDNCLAYNNQHFSKSVFLPLKSLTYLDIGYQFCTSGDMERNYLWFSTNVISDLTTLQSIVIDVACLPCFHNFNVFPEEFMLLTNLTHFKGGICIITIDDKTFSNVPHVDKMDLSGCMIKSYAHGAFQGRQFKYFNLQSIFSNWTITLDILSDIKNKSVQTLVLTHTFYFFVETVSLILYTLAETGLENLYLNENNLLMSGCFESGLPASLKYLDVSSNKLTDVCFLMPNLQILNLERNNLRDYLRFLRYYPFNPIVYPTNLSNINLSFNNLDYLLVSLFHGHRCLRNLNLSNNFLTDINFDVYHLTSLKVIDLSNNKIQKFSKESMEQLNIVFVSSDIKINLAGNSLQCSCDAIQFIEWILEKEEYFSNKGEIKCKFLNETEIFLTDFRGTMMELKKTCAPRLVLIISVAAAITSIIIIATIGVVYRYRWRLRYIYYMTKSKYIRDNLNQNDDRNYTFDAFIAYSDDEQDFINNECIPILEERDNVKLCVHKRDFLPGREIFHNITTSIHESRTVICIITKSFLESYYCMFEFNMARMESIYSRNGQNMLFLVFYEQLRPKDLPLVMLELVDKDSYIEYPNDEQGNIVFWEKLKEAMT